MLLILNWICLCNGSGISLMISVRMFVCFLASLLNSLPINSCNQHDCECRLNANDIDFEHDVDWRRCWRQLERRHVDQLSREARSQIKHQTVSENRQRQQRSRKVEIGRQRCVAGLRGQRHLPIDWILLSRWTHSSLCFFFVSLCVLKFAGFSFFRFIARWPITISFCESHPTSI
jgi:hypothetical protein